MTTTIEKVVRGDVIAAEAVKALTAPGFASQPGYCQRFVREVVQAACGDLFDRYWRDSAFHTMEAFAGTAYALKPDNPLQVGDVLQKGRLTSGRFGHTAIVVPGGFVAENSSVHWEEGNPDADARGRRTLAAFGQFEQIVRLSLYRG